jgi:hypothetical protein
MNNIKLKQLFYNENKSLHLIDEHNVYNKQSLASYIQLKRFYYNICNIGSMPLSVRIYLNFRNKFLKRKEKENKGNLVCFYCGKEHLDTNTNNPNKKRAKATIDHYIPQSQNGGKFDENNIKVCCMSCNNYKKDLSPNQFYNKIKNNKNYNGLFKLVF